jgi:Outer membrane protein beta-barrel domain
MIRKTIFICLVLLVGWLTSYSQEESSYELSTVSDPVHLGIYANVGVPSAEFRNAVDNGTGLGAGFNFNVLASPYGTKKYSPVLLGIDFNYLYLGRDKVDATATAPPYKTNFNYYTVAAATRILLRKNEGITPFIDGILGMKIYHTKTKIDKDAFQTILADEQPEVVHSNSDTGLTYGVGLGIYKRKFDELGEGTTNRASFSLRAMYLWGDEIEYVKRGTLVVDPDLTVNYDTGHTNTNMFMIQLGLYIF